MTLRLLTFLFSGLLLLPLNSWAASCCGGGSASSLVLPKGARYMLDWGLSHEQYDGSWNSSGYHLSEPSGNDLTQTRTNFGFAYRLADRWQMSAQVPYVWNDSKYPSIDYQSDGIGDSSVGFWYETFDDIKCVWKVVNWNSLVPAVYLGGSLNIPTGKSIYNIDVQDSSESTGIGFYRWDTKLLVDKTIYPWTATYSLTHGKYLERPVNAESGNYVQPYDKLKGDRLSQSITLGYSYFFESQATLVVTASFNHLREKAGEIDGQKDSSLTGFKKQSAGLSLAYSTPALDWIYKLSFNHSLTGNGRGRNFPTTDIISLGVSYVIR